MGLLTILFRERQTWRCSHCLVHGSAVWAVRDGPVGPRVLFSPLLKLRNQLMVFLKSLCNNCGLFYERDKRLPPWARNLHHLDPPIGAR